MNKKDLIKKITQKKEFSQLPNKDIEMAFEKMNNERYLDEEKVKLTRDLLRKVFSAFTSNKLLLIKEKEPEWFLRKHISTRERLPYYREVYGRILKNLDNKISIIDLGAGINGFSYGFLKEIGFDVNYTGIESVGQLVKLTNHFFDKDNINKKAKAIHLSIFELDKVKEIIKNERGTKIVFLFKTIDSLEMLKRDYSEKLLFNIVPLVNRVIVSFATRSLVKKEKFRANRNWILSFIKENFLILDDFEIGGERYVVFQRK